MKPRKIVLSKNVKEKMKKLSPGELRLLKKAMKQIAKNPFGAHTMSINGEPSPEELMNWMHGTKPEHVDEVLEYLQNKHCLSEKGEKLALSFWKKYIKTK